MARAGRPPTRSRGIRAGLVGLLALLVACSSTPSKGDASTRVADAAASPLADLNLVQASIPPVLTEARREPYRPPAPRTCSELAREIGQLDLALGADLDQPASEPSLLERGGEEAGDAAIDTIKSAAEGMIPFRAWVRRLSGADRHSKAVAAAVAAGTVRRAYLKGLGQALRCAPPAAPRPPDGKH